MKNLFLKSLVLAVTLCSVSTNAEEIKNVKHFLKGANNSLVIEFTPTTMPDYQCIYLAGAMQCLKKETTTTKKSN